VPKVNPVCLGASVSDPTEVFVKHRVEARPLRGVERDQRIVSRLGDCGLHADLMGCGAKAGVAPVAAGELACPGRYRQAQREDNRCRTLNFQVRITAMRGPPYGRALAVAPVDMLPAASDAQTR
jgi:hypothetical protein